MIELPETCVLTRQLNETIRGKRVTAATANHTPHGFAWYTGDPVEYGQKLKGKTVAGADIFSASVRIALGDMYLLIGTPIKYHAPGERRPDKHQLLVDFADGSAISCTVQMWGVMFCYRKGDEAAGIRAGHITRSTPTPLDTAFDRAYYLNLAAAAEPRTMSAKALLATEQRIQGLGNGVLQDILWTARIHPKRKLTTLSADDHERLFDAVKSVLSEMTAQGGRDTERDLFGRPGGYRTVLSKNTVGKPCPVCGTPIRKEAYLGGAIYYCANCQPLA